MFTRTVFSSVRGRISIAGQPAAGLEVVQRWSWMSVDDGEARTKTDAQGQFSFPAVTVRRLMAPKDLMVHQELEVAHREKRISLWNLTRQDTTPDGELGGEPIELTADLDQPEREVKLPLGKDRLALVSGVATFRHPYLERRDEVRKQLGPEGVALALKQFLSSPDGMKGLQPFVPAVGSVRRAVVGIGEVTDVRLEDDFLFNTVEAGDYALRERPRFVGFTARAQVELKLDSGEALKVGFFAWTLFLPVDENGKPTLEIRSAGRWEVDTREWVRQQAGAMLVPAKVVAMVRAGLQAAPGEPFLEAVGAKSAGELVVEDVEIGEVRIDGTRDDWATLNVLGRARLDVSGRKESPRFRGHFTVQLDSLMEPEYRLVPGRDAPSVRVFRFAATLETDKKVYAPGERILLRFQVENLMGTPQRFLIWHTPFEGFRNDFLEVERMGGEKVAYRGMMASLAPPGPEAYLTLKPGETTRSEIEITEAYPVVEEGDYVLRYRPLDAVWADEIGFAVR